MENILDTYRGKEERIRLEAFHFLYLEIKKSDLKNLILKALFYLSFNFSFVPSLVQEI